MMVLNRHSKNYLDLIFFLINIFNIQNNYYKMDGIIIILKITLEYY